MSFLMRIFTLLIPTQLEEELLVECKCCFYCSKLLSNLFPALFISCLLTCDVCLHQKQTSLYRVKRDYIYSRPQSFHKLEPPWELLCMGFFLKHVTDENSSP